MSKEIEAVARQQLQQVGVNIAVLRNIRRMSQEALAERAGISAVELSLIESAGTYKAFSIEVFYNISKALGVEPDMLLSGKRRDVEEAWGNG